MRVARGEVSDEVPESRPVNNAICGGGGGEGAAVGWRSRCHSSGKHHKTDKQAAGEHRERLVIIALS